MMNTQKTQWQEVAPGGLKGKVVSAHEGAGISFICLGEMNTGQDLTITSDDLPFVIEWLQRVQQALAPERIPFSKAAAFEKTEEFLRWRGAAGDEAMAEWQELTGGGINLDTGQWEIFISPNRPPHGWNAMILAFNHVHHRLDRPTLAETKRAALAMMITMLDEWKTQAEGARAELDEVK